MWLGIRMVHHWYLPVTGKEEEPIDRWLGNGLEITYGTIIRSCDLILEHGTKWYGCIQRNMV